MTGQVDYFFLFANTAAAQADPTVGSYWDATNLAWRGDVCFPGLKVVTSQALLNGIATGLGFWIMISSQGPNAALAAHANCAVATDRGLAPGGAFVLSATMTAAGHQTLQVSPVPMGSAYPQPFGK